MALKVGYAYPTSTHAAACGASTTGCYIVERTHNVTTGRPLKTPVLAIKMAFKTEDVAQKWADGWAA
ncbi:MAG: hypothetical protein AAF192_08655 [Pseudomonadota bacterium]